MMQIPEGNRQSNVDRFSGYKDLYDQHRPRAPREAVRILTGYLRHKPRLVLDVGCGTGLSTFAWKNDAETIVGIEPNDDMRSKAEEKLRALQTDDADAGRIRFLSGYSNKLEFPDDSADLITCSQSFHWMEPVSTLAEAARVLKPGGIFAAYDCDWPPSASWEAEQAYMELLNKADQLLKERQNKQDQAYKRDKESHLACIQQSGHFRYAREIVFHNRETCDSKRYIGLALSQGGLQTVIKLGFTELDDELERFQALVKDYFQDRTLETLFSYRMRIGIK